MSEQQTYEDVNERLKQIVEEVSDETLPLDDALDLFEEAVKLGMEASTMMEEDMAARDAQAEADEIAADQAFEHEQNDAGEQDVAVAVAQSDVQVAEGEVAPQAEGTPQAEVAPQAEAIPYAESTPVEIDDSAELPE